MASIYKRVLKNGKEAPKYTVSWKDSSGRYRSKVAYEDRTQSQALASKLESESALVRDGLIKPEELTRREASRKLINEHIEDYRLDLLARERTLKHARGTASSIKSLLEDASIQRLTELTPDRIQSALGRMRQRRAPRTCNFARGAVKAFATWLENSARIESHKLKSLSKFSEESDRSRERRAMTGDELIRFLGLVRGSGPMGYNKELQAYHFTPKGKATGEERYWLYRIACETGFRKSELGSLNRESFKLDQSPPVIVCMAAHTKNGKRAEQQIRHSFADELRPHVESMPKKGPAVRIPLKTAKMLKADLEAVGMPYRDESGHYLDFHALRATYITQLIKGGADIKTVQMLARHSSPVLTLAVYAKSTASDKSAALDGLPTNSVCSANAQRIEPHHATLGNKKTS